MTTGEFSEGQGFDPKSSGWYLHGGDEGLISLGDAERSSVDDSLISYIETDSSDDIAWVEKEDLKRLLDKGSVYRIGYGDFNDKSPYFTIDFVDDNEEVDYIKEGFTRRVMGAIAAGKTVEAVLNYDASNMTFASVVRELDSYVGFETTDAIVTEDTYMEVRLYIDGGQVTSDTTGRYVYVKGAEAGVTGTIYGSDIGELGGDLKTVFYQLDDSDGRDVYCDVLIDTKTGELRIMSSEIRRKDEKLL